MDHYAVVRCSTRLVFNLFLVGVHYQTIRRISFFFFWLKKIKKIAWCSPSRRVSRLFLANFALGIILLPQLQT